MLSIMQCPNCGHAWRRGPLRADVDARLVAQDYLAGMTLRQVAVKYRCAYSTARLRLLDAGVQLRPRARKAARPDGVR
jgi:type IV secretory pathway VirB6-like protein